MKMRFLLVVLCMAFSAGCGAVDASAPKSDAKASQLDLNRDILGPSVFLVSRDTFWTLADAQALVSMIETYHDAKMRATAIEDIKTFMSLPDLKYREGTLAGNKVAALFKVFAISPSKLSDFPGWLVYTSRIPPIKQDDDALAKILGFVDAVLVGPGGKIVANKNLSKSALNDALRVKKDLDKTPFAFLYKKAKPSVISVRGVLKTAIGAYGLIKGAEFVAGIPEMRAAVRDAQRLGCALGSEDQRQVFSGPSMVLYRLKKASWNYRIEQFRHKENGSLLEKRVFAGFTPAADSFVYPAGNNAQNLEIRKDTTRPSGTFGLNMAYNHVVPDADHFKDGEFWLPRQIVLLEDVVESDPRQFFNLGCVRADNAEELSTFGKCFFGEDWEMSATGEVEVARFKQLLRLLIPSVDLASDLESFPLQEGQSEDSDDLSLASKVMDGMAGAVKNIENSVRDVITFQTSGPMISSFKDHLVLPAADDGAFAKAYKSYLGCSNEDNRFIPFAGQYNTRTNALNRVKLWAWFRVTRDMARLASGPDDIIRPQDFSPVRVKYEDLYAYICQLLSCISKNTGNITVREDTPRHLRYLEEHTYSELAPFLFSDALRATLKEGVPFYLKDSSLRIAQRINQYSKYESSIQSESDLYRGVPVELLFGGGKRSFGPSINPMEFGVDSRTQGASGFKIVALPEDLRAAILTMRARGLAPFPYFAMAKLQGADEAFSSKRVCLRSDLQAEGGSDIAARGTTSRRAPRGTRSDKAMNVLYQKGDPSVELPAWMFTEYAPGVGYGDILPGVLGLYHSDGVSDYFANLPNYEFDSTNHRSAKFARLLVRYNQGSEPTVHAVGADGRVGDALNGELKVVIIDEKEGESLQAALNDRSNYSLLQDALQRGGGHARGLQNTDGFVCYKGRKQDWNMFDFVLNGILKYLGASVGEGLDSDIYPTANWRLLARARLGSSEFSTRPCDQGMGLCLPCQSRGELVGAARCVPLAADLDEDFCRRLTESREFARYWSAQIGNISIGDQGFWNCLFSDHQLLAMYTQNYDEVYAKVQQFCDVYNDQQYSEFKRMVQSRRFDPGLLRRLKAPVADQMAHAIIPTKHLFVDLREFVRRQRRSIEFCDFRHIAACAQPRGLRLGQDMLKCIHRQRFNISSSGWGIPRYTVAVPFSTYSLAGSEHYRSLKLASQFDGSSELEEIDRSAFSDVCMLRKTGWYPNPYLRFYVPSEEGAGIARS